MSPNTAVMFFLRLILSVARTSFMAVVCFCQISFICMLPASAAVGLELQTSKDESWAGCVG